MDIPKVLHLQIEDEEGNEIEKLHQVTWACDPVNTSDVKYIRADEDERKRKALRFALSIIDRLSNEYSAVAGRHSSFTQGEYRQIMSAIHPEFQEPEASEVAQ